ncbi:MAG: hypothetical protein CVU95_02130 [Firmicutes bacterium HGW-Firmicutes-2]|jgi:hypothetical protein|nr:MAG: hypothetical protein CVU95_02130 [Firmicutes bacterium HGW-Firmicutes-2]
MDTNKCCGDSSKDFKDMAGKMEGMPKMMGGGFNPMDMCKQMTESITTTARMAGFATPEVQVIFEDWVLEVEKEIMQFIKLDVDITPAKIAEHLKISEDSVLYFISKLIRDKKIVVTGLAIK